MRNGLALVMVMAGGLAAPSVAAADGALVARAGTENVGKSRVEFEAGVEAYDQGQYELALRHFQHSHALSHNAVLYFNMAACEEHLDHYSAAALLLRQYLIERPDAEDTDKVQVRIRVLQERDDQVKKLSDAARPLPPVSAAPSPSPAPPVATPPARRRLAWIALAATGALGVATGATALYAAADHSSLKGGCGATAAGCSSSEIDGLKRAALATDVLLGLTVAAAVTTVVLFVVHGRRAPEQARSAALVF